MITFFHFANTFLVNTLTSKSKNLITGEIYGEINVN